MEAEGVNTAYNVWTQLIWPAIGTSVVAGAGIYAFNELRKFTHKWTNPGRYYGRRERPNVMRRTSEAYSDAIDYWKDSLKNLGPLVAANNHDAQSGLRNLRWAIEDMNKLQPKLKEYEDQS